MPEQTVKRSRFAEFFAAVNSGHAPFTWQEELLDYILDHGEWPRQVTAPTGAGKSAVVDIHIFANAVASADGPRIPRRLHTVVNRRALVDNQADHAQRIKKLLQMAMKGKTENPILHEVAEALCKLRGDCDDTPLEVGHLRGELPTRTLPLEELSACSVIAATPDMWGSRLLFRGYGSSKYARPRETALVGMDSVVVVDESHLSRQLVATARRVAQLQRREQHIGVPTLQVTETSATVATDEDTATTVAVRAQELSGDCDALLRKRLYANKKFTYVPVNRWDGRPRNLQVINTAVEHAQRLHSTHGATVGIIVNHIKTATSIASSLRKAGLTTLTLVGRMRPWDLEQLRKKYPNAFTVTGDSTVDVIVATQTLEVGIDISFTSLVTELAPSSSLAQRFGRTNRLGKYDNADIIVIGPPSDKKVTKDAPPYSASDMCSARQWVEKLEEEGFASPAVLEKIPPPPSELSRVVEQRIELADLDFLSRTSDPLVAEPSLELWLRDSLEDDTKALGIVVRDNLPTDVIATLELLKEFPPFAEEVFPAKFSEIRSILQRDRNLRVFLYRDDDVFTFDASEDGLKPGDIIIVDEGLRFTTEFVVDEHPSDDPPCQVVIDDASRPLIKVHSPSDSEAEKNIFRQLVNLNSSEAAEKLGVDMQNWEVVLSKTIVDSNRRDAVAWYALKPLVAAGSEILQEWTSSTRAVFLKEHQTEVAERARLIADALGITNPYAEQIERAALHHDDGKSDPRFQAMLGRIKDEAKLAKSRERTKQEVHQARMLSGLPAGWRHEQLSALLLAQTHGLASDNEIALRVVGTSHGRGRLSFPHVGAEILDEENDAILRDIAEHLFTTGGWDSLIMRTNRKYGHYAVSFAEAIERAADAQISKETK